MTNPANQVTPYTQDTDSKKEQVRRMFDGIAPHYDGLNRLLSAGMDRRWRTQAIQVLEAGAKTGTGAGASILDIATGTGDLAFEILQFSILRFSRSRLQRDSVVLKSTKRSVINIRRSMFNLIAVQTMLGDLCSKFDHKGFSDKGSAFTSYLTIIP